MKLYHVTFQTNVSKILYEGIRSDKRSIWRSYFGEKLGKKGGVYAFDKWDQAFRWAHKQWWDFDRPVTIVEFIDDNFIEDPNGGFVGGLIKFGDIKPEQIRDVYWMEWKTRRLGDIR